MKSIHEFKLGVKNEAAEGSSGIGKVIGKLFEARNVAHHAHLMATGAGSHARHIALQGFYEAIVPLADQLFETYAGQYGLVNFDKNGSAGDEEIVAYMQGLHKMLMDAHDLIDKRDSHLHNILDEIVAEVSSLLYKLRFLK